MTNATASATSSNHSDAVQKLRRLVDLISADTYVAASLPLAKQPIASEWRVKAQKGSRMDITMAAGPHLITIEGETYEMPTTFSIFKQEQLVLAKKLEALVDSITKNHDSASAESSATKTLELLNGLGYSEEAGKMKFEYNPEKAQLALNKYNASIGYSRFSKLMIAIGIAVAAFIASLAIGNPLVQAIAVSVGTVGFFAMENRMASRSTKLDPNRDEEAGVAKGARILMNAHRA